MRIEYEIKLGFKDVMIRPKRSTLKSRSQVSLERNFTFVNAGVCGNKAYDLVNRLDRDILSQKPDLTFILIGTNDSGAERKCRKNPINRRASMYSGSWGDILDSGGSAYGLSTASS